MLILALWLPATSNAMIITFAATFGFASGAYVSLSQALVAQISPDKELGYRMGLLFFFASFAGLTTNPIAGTMLGQDGSSFVDVKIYSSVMCISGTTLVVAARLWHTGFHAWVKF